MTALLASELVANAVAHGRTRVHVTVRRQDNTVRVEVQDENPRLPVMTMPPPEATSGRGLVVVEGLSHTWGVDRTTHGKTVWFEVTPELPDAPAAGTGPR